MRGIRADAPGVIPLSAPIGFGGVAGWVFCLLLPAGRLCIFVPMLAGRTYSDRNAIPYIGALLAVFLCLFAGCASVPDTQFLKRRYTSAAVKFESAWGPLSAKQSAALMDSLKRRSGSLDLLDRQIQLEQVIVGEALVLGNRVTLLQDGPATYRAMFEAIEHAKETINVESYIIGNDEIGRKFADALLAKQAAGVQVNVIYDGIGAFSTPKSFFDRLRRGGVRVVEFNPFSLRSLRAVLSVNHRDHRKLMIIDGQTAFLGGINIDSVYSSGSTSAPKHRMTKRAILRGGWRDTDIEVEGPVVAQFQKLFLQTWQTQHGPPLAERIYFPQVPPKGNAIVRAIGSTPDDAYNAIYLTFVAAITNAQKQIYITNAYFVPDPQLVRALLDAVKRGVDVRIILPSTSDSRSAAYAARSHYAELLEGGVRIYERRWALLHAKTAVVDGVWSCVGSSNLDWRSAVDNDEINAVILGPDFANQMLAAYRLDEAESDEVHLSTWKTRRPAERIKEWFFRLCGRLL